MLYDNVRTEAAKAARAEGYTNFTVAETPHKWKKSGNLVRMLFNILTDDGAVLDCCVIETMCNKPRAAYFVEMAVIA